MFSGHDPVSVTLFCRGQATFVCCFSFSPRLTPHLKAVVLQALRTSFCNDVQFLDMIDDSLDRKERFADNLGARWIFTSRIVETEISLNWNCNQFKLKASKFCQVRAQVTGGVEAGWFVGGEMSHLGIIISTGDPLQD